MITISLCSKQIEVSRILFKLIRADCQLVSKLRGVEVVLTLAIIALLPISSACLGTIAIFAQTLSSQSPTSNNTTSIENTTAAGGTTRGNNVAEEADSSNDTTTSI